LKIRTETSGQRQSSREGSALVHVLGPVKGEVPTLDLILAYHKANNSPMLKLLLSRVGKLVGAPA
jgi:hypothetical protein